MAIATLSDLRDHLALTDGVAVEDNAMLERFLAAAQGLVEGWLGYSIATEYPDGTPPEALVVAVLQIAAHWYERREAATEKTLTVAPFSARAIVDLYRARSF